MKAKTIYLLLGVLGIALPYWQFIPWVAAHHGIPLPIFWHELFSTRIGTFFGMDLLASAVVLLVFMRVESSRKEVKSRWLVIPALMFVGVSLALPLFLYLRELGLEQGTANSAPSPTSRSK
jgi:Protein of unknown function DUF2834